MKAYLLVFFLFVFTSAPTYSQNKKKVVRKVQEVNFAEMSIKGTIRNPDGAFLVQKNMDKKIRDASFYVR